ncbi:MAG: aspartate--tRNA ligase [Planctomycetota bacterium]|jgi:aspartyl-tRNA synthetase|nr:aspartate--tRNA ligase [Planctomycetota bacterium]
MKRTHTCGELRREHEGLTVTLAGWAQNRRDHGGLMFIDLRDRYGLTQIVFDPARPETLKLGQEVRSEWVLQVTGRVAPRPPEMANPKLATGEIELAVESFRVFSRACALPFEIDEHARVGEEARLAHRYLDLRRPAMQANLAARHRFVRALRETLDGLGFLEIETPVLAKSTPEGARDYLVPSRVHPGRFYALPQSPQLFKQLCMIGGCDRYYQIARCFRDEDLRADRQPEFTQLDLEMSFADEEDVFAVTEACLKNAFRQGGGVEAAIPFPRLTWKEAMARYGCDKPDLRFGLELSDLSDLAAGSDFKVFRSALAAGGVVKGLAIPGGDAFSRRELDVELLEIAKPHGAKGLAWIKISPAGEYSGAPAKFFPKERLDAIRDRLAAKPGDALAFSADRAGVVNASLAAVRNHLGQVKLGLVRPGSYRFAWVTDFPAFEWSPEERRWQSAHHPFTSVNEEDRDFMLAADPAREDSGLDRVRSAAYDLVLNGSEVASGSVRIHDSRLQEKIFRVLGLSEEGIRDRFGFFTEALGYGTPPHAGIAPGIDRLVAMLLGLDSIREVIAFPKNARAADLMSGAPGEVEARQLRELGIARLEEDGAKA